MHRRRSVLTAAEPRLPTATASSALVKGQLGGFMRFVEPLYLRGPFSILIAPVAEAATEHFVLRFGSRKMSISSAAHTAQRRSSESMLQMNSCLR